MKTIMEYFWKIFCSLRPSENPDPKVQLAWRWTVAVLLFGMVIVTGVSFAWAQGMIPHLSGVATKQDVSDAKQDVNAKLSTFSSRVDSIEKTVNSINLRMIKTDIQQAVADSCTAQERGNQAALQRANDDLFGTNSSEGLLDQYQNLAGRPFVIPSCNSVLIVQKPTAPGGH